MTMRKINVVSDEFSQHLGHMKQEYTQRGRWLAALEQMRQRVLMGEVCGSWVALEGTGSALIRREGDGLSVMLCDNARCYKSVTQELVAVARGRRLVLSPGGGELRITDDGYLDCGPYGLFCSEESVLRDELRCELDFALRDVDYGEDEA